MKPDSFVEIGHHQVFKHGEMVGGDVFISNRIREENRIVSVLADGLGSGIKASVLATLTGTMAARCVSSEIDIRRTAEIIMDMLPVCRERKIAYSTFTIVDANVATGETRIIEHENPPFIFLRNGKVCPVQKSEIPLDRRRRASKHHTLLYSNLTVREGDRLLFFTDGVSQSGTGSPAMPVGWGMNGAGAFVCDAVRRDCTISAQRLARDLVHQACINDNWKSEDDTTAAAIYVRRPRRLLLVTGPPFLRRSDIEVARRLEAFHGRKIICGGTTAALLARELKRDIDLENDCMDPEIPPCSKMKGIDLVTEGTLTLGAVAELLEHGPTPERDRLNGATRTAALLLESDVINFCVGTRINDAHQDPNVPVELDIRRNIVKKIRTLLEQKYMKETTLELV